MVDPARRAVSERWLGVLRIGFAALATPAVVDGWDVLLAGLDVLTAVGLAALALTGLAAVALGRRAPGRVARWTTVSDVVVFGVLAAAQAHEDLTLVAVLLLVPALVGGLRYGLRGSLVTLAWDGAVLAVWVLLHTRVAGGSVSEVGLLVAVSIVALVGVLAGQLTDQAETERRRAERGQREAEAARRRTERAVRELEMLNRIFVVGLEAMETHRALQSILREVAEELEYANLSVVRRADDGRLRHAASSDPRLDAAPPVPDPGGPVEQALSEGRSMIATGPDAEELDLGLPDMVGEAVAPIRVEDDIIGALVAETADTDHFDHLTLRSLERIADQLGLVVALADMLDRETELAERYRELDRLKTDFVAIASHELRTPLTAILGFSETLQDHDEHDDELTDRLVGGIRRNARRLERLVDDLRTVSRIDGGQLEVRRERTDVDRVVANVLESMAPVTDLHTAGPEGLELRGDPHRLHQVLTNLVRNAVDHAGGRIELLWRAADDAVEFRVRDEGPGVPAEARTRIFERFAQAGEPLSHHKGTGLGLAIARELIDAMDGRLTLDTTYRDGACFVVRLPAWDGPATPAPEADGDR